LGRPSRSLSRPFLSIVVPAYNEETRIGPCIDRLRTALPALVPSWEILVADDGSRDRTREVVSALAAEDDRVRLLALPHRGKGEAVKRGLLEARGEWRFMADADLATPPDNLPRFLEHTSDSRTALVIGSREAPGAQRLDEPWIRHVIGRAFNWFVRACIVSGISDTQCGFKLLSADAVEAICPYLTIDGFAFDVEMLALADRAGLTIREVGVTWDGDQESRVAFGGGAKAFVDVLRIRWRLWRGAYSTQPRPAGLAGPADHLRQGYGGPPKRFAKAEAGHEVIERVGPFSVRTWAYVLALTCAAALAYDLLRMPVQVFDALEEMLAAHRSTSLVDTFWSAAYNAAYLRPLRIVQIKAIFDAAQGHYWLAFRGLHAATMVCCLLLFTRALRVRTVADLTAAAFALSVVAGLHTFRSTVQEAFPINHFLEIAVLALVILNLSQARPRLSVDLAAMVTFVVASLTLESGLLVWVIAVTAWVLGMRGVSTRGVVALTVLLAGYFVLRFGLLSVGTPGLIERSSGYLFDVLDPPELAQRFGDRLATFYAYNVVSSALSVLMSEPQNGLFVTLKAWLDGRMTSGLWLTFVSSLVTTALIASACVHVLRRYRASDPSDRLILLFAVVLAANAAFSYAYTKDDIMSVSGVFYAIAAYAAIRVLIGRVTTNTMMAAVLTTVILATGTAWNVRSLGIHHVARTHAFKTRNDWASQPGSWKRSGRWPADASSQQLITQLRNDALSMRLPNPYFEPPWIARLWGD
jgi:dolichyl-phosphate beta-glucosyltransferase